MRGAFGAVGRDGSSLIELGVVLAVVAVLSALALPGLARGRARADVSAARVAFVSAHSLTRQIAAQYGTLAALHVDPPSDRFWVSADTSVSPPHPAWWNVRPPLNVAERFRGVRLEGPTRTLCFDARGLATPRGGCDLPNVTLVFRSGSVADTVTVSRLGRLSWR